jgi:hypothetical protein
MPRIRYAYHILSRIYDRCVGGKENRGNDLLWGWRRPASTSESNPPTRLPSQRNAWPSSVCSKGSAGTLTWRESRISSSLLCVLAGPCQGGARGSRVGCRAVVQGPVSEMCWSVVLRGRGRSNSYAVEPEGLEEVPESARSLSTMARLRPGT